MNHSSDPVDQQALQSLPHGSSFRFVDELLELTPGVNAVAIYTISGDESFLSGHFPGNPIWPAVIMIEAIAQLGGVVAQTSTESTPLNDMRLTAVKNAKITGSATAGAELRIEAQLEARMGSLVQVSGKVSQKLANDEFTLLAKASVMLSGT